MSGSRLCDSYFIQPTMNGVKKYSIAQFGHMDPVSLKKKMWMVLDVLILDY